MPWNVTGTFQGVLIEFSSLKEVFVENFLEPLEGIIAIVHNANEFPSRTSQSFKFDGYFRTWVAVTLELVIIDEDLKSCKPEARNCYTWLRTNWQKSQRHNENMQIFGKRLCIKCFERNLGWDYDHFQKLWLLTTMTRRMNLQST